MTCPACRSPMEQLTLAGSLGSSVTIDLCRACRAFWFDPYEDLHLTAQSTVRLFQMMTGGGNASPIRSAACPTCGTPLILTHDRQRNTPFVYWRCDRGHGRCTPFTEFLRQKDFIRQPTPKQLAELRKSIQMIRCAGCGAPIDLVHDSKCNYCGSPISILDIEKLAQLAAPIAATPPPPQLIPTKYMPQTESSLPPTLIDLGLEVLGDWLTDLITR
ncbi:MAG TPA: zf-TFIIB domain-containing protein [Thermoanaerobaculia bacterium]|nr:zf-TFIIB domain-containing protein [Thermoanaerobaculia bacterium]